MSKGPWINYEPQTKLCRKWRVEAWKKKNGYPTTREGREIWSLFHALDKLMDSRDPDKIMQRQSRSIEDEPKVVEY